MINYHRIITSNKFNEYNFVMNIIILNDKFYDEFNILMNI